MDARRIEYIEMKLTDNDIKKRISHDFDISVDHINNQHLKLLKTIIQDSTEQEYVKILQENPHLEYFGVEQPLDHGVDFRERNTNLLDKNRILSEYEFHQIQRFLVPQTYYHINVKVATWTIIGLLLDLFITRGIAVTLLASAGLIGRAIGLLNRENGELCIYFSALSLVNEASETFQEADILSKIARRPCTNPKLVCPYRKNTRCTIKKTNITEIFGSLKDKGVFTKNSFGKWKIEP